MKAEDMREMMCWVDETMGAREPHMLQFARQTFAAFFVLLVDSGMVENGLPKAEIMAWGFRGGDD